MKKLVLAALILTAGFAHAGENTCTDSNGNFTAPGCTSGGAVYTSPISGTTRVCVSLTPDTSAYAASDIVRGGTSSTTPLTFSNVFRSKANSGILQSIAITNTEIDGIPWRLCLWNAAPTTSTVTDQGAMTVTAADLQKVIGCFSVATGTAFATTELYEANNIVKAVDASSTSVYATLQTTGAPTWAAAQTVNICLTFLED